MANYTVRNIPERVYSLLRRRAERRGRSFNAEILSILNDEAALDRRRAEMARALPELRRRREELARKYPTTIDSTALIREDRDSR